MDFAEVRAILLRNLDTAYANLASVLSNPDTADESKDFISARTEFITIVNTALDLNHVERTVKQPD